MLFINPMLGPDDSWAGFRAEFPADEFDPAALSALSASPLRSSFDSRLFWCLPGHAAGLALPENDTSLILVFTATPETGPDALRQHADMYAAQGIKTALKHSPEHKLPATGTWDTLLINASHARSLPPYTLIGLGARSKLIGTEVHSQTDRRWLLDNACPFTSDEFLLARNGEKGKPDLTRLKLLKLLGLITADADTAELEAILREEPKLSYSLLRLVNSAAVAPRSEITSFSQAINLLGRKQLQRWIQLLIYSDPENGQRPTPLLQKAAARGQLLERLSATQPVADEGMDKNDLAFMIGAFSLLDILLDLPMPEILRQLPLPPSAKLALEKREGALGKLLDAVDAADRHDFKTAQTKLHALAIKDEAYLDAQLATLAWASKIRPA